MSRHFPTQRPARLASYSRLLLRFGKTFSREFAVLDAGCGAGRNAIALAQLGLTVVCADRDEQRLAQIVRDTPTEGSRGALMPICADLEPATWPFGVSCFSAIVCVHYLDAALFPCFHSSLVPDGHLYIETVGGQGQNYLELPAAGELHALLSPSFILELYQERPVGPAASNRRAVKLLARKVQRSRALTTTDIVGGHPTPARL
jgi:SAM-dependent methyltransferase